MKKGTFKKVLVLVMCAALISTALVSCGDDTSDIEADPAGYLQDALDSTMADIKTRYTMSPLAAISNSMSSSLSAIEFQSTINYNVSDTYRFGGIAYVDSEAQRMLLDGSFGSLGVSVDAGFYYDPEFVGVSMPFMFGSNGLYGFRPYNLVEQAQGSIFDASTGSELGMDISQLQALDDMLDSFRNSDGLSIQNIVDEITAAGDEFNASLEYTVEQQKVTVAGEEKDGYILSTEYTGEDIASLMESIFSIMKQSSLFTVIFNMADQSGSGTTEADFDAQVDAVIEELKADQSQVSISYEICDGKVISADMEADGNSTGYSDITVDYYGEDGNTVSISSGGVGLFTSQVDTSDGYYHTITMNSSADPAVNSAVNMASGWDSDTGDIVLNIETVDAGTVSSVGFSGTLTAADGEGFSLDITDVTLDGGDGGISFSISGQDIDTFPDVGEKINIFDLTEDELYSILMNFYSVDSGYSSF